MESSTITAEAEAAAPPEAPEPRRPRGRFGARRAVPVAAAGPGGAAVLLPGRAAGEWTLCRPAAAATPEDAARAATRQTFASLAAAALALQPAEGFVLALPVEAGLVQRLALPAADPAEIEEMARIQLEKILPYPVEAVNLAWQEVARTGTDVTLAVETIHQDTLAALCQPLTARGCWPLRVVFQALLLAAGAPAGENTAFLYEAGGRYTLAVSEGGRLCFAQALHARTAEDLAGELPATLLGAELDGVPTAFGRVRLDDAAAEWRGTLAAALGVPVEPFEPATALLAGAGRAEGDLSPPGWRAARLRGERAVRLRRRLLWAAGAYLGALLLLFGWLGVMKLRVARLNGQLKKLLPAADYTRAQDARWQALAPALQPPSYVVDTFRQVYECLPPGDVIRLTGYEQRPGALTVQGEAPSTSAASDFADKLKQRPALKAYRLEPDPPKVLPNGRFSFVVKTAGGKPGENDQ